MSDLENYAKFYTNKNLGFDLKIVEKGFLTYKPFFRGTKCLELGPASGYMTRYLIDCFETVTVVEGSKTLIDQIPNYNNLIKINSFFDDFETNIKYDTIILNHILEHLENPILLLNKVYECLSDIGICIIGVPNAKSFHRLAAVKMGLLSSEYELNERDKDLGHFRVYDLELLRAHVEKANLKIFFESGIFIKFLSNQQIDSFLDDKIIDAYFDIASNFYQNSAEVFVIAHK